MRYLLLIYYNQQDYNNASEADREATFKGYMALNAELRAANVMRTGASLMQTSAATAVRVRDGKTLTTHGPFAETKEQLSGYYEVECSNLDEAIVWASKIPTAQHGTIEIRPIQEIPGV